MKTLTLTIAVSLITLSTVAKPKPYVTSYKLGDAKACEAMLMDSFKKGYKKIVKVDYVGDYVIYYFAK